MQKKRDSLTIEEADTTYEGTESAQFESLSLPEYRQTKGAILDERINLKTIFSPALGLYTGPTATKDLASAITFGLNFNNCLCQKAVESIRYGIALTTSLDLFLNISNQFTLKPRMWGNPYYNLNINFAIDPGNMIGSFINMQNFSFGGAYGVKIKKNWSIESRIGLLSLKGTSFAISAIYGI